MSRVAVVQPVGDDVTDLDEVARASANVMVTSGSSAERTAWARAVHDRSAGRDGPFVAVCGDAVPPVHRTGGRVLLCGPGGRCDDVNNWFGRAAGGTLFIDHIEQLSLDAQGQLFSLLSEQSLGDAAMMPVATDCVRVVAGSNRSLGAELALGAFSRALFYRLNVIHIDHLHHNGEDAMKARDIMSKPPCTCGQDTDLAAVAKLMWDHDCGFVPVVDASGTVAGVVTDRDICIATSTRRLLPEQISAAQAMTTTIHACMSDDSVSDVLATMKQFQVRRVPVIDGSGKIQGVISLNDLVLASNDKRDPKSAEVVSTMAAICGHRQIETAVA